MILMIRTGQMLIRIKQIMIVNLIISTRQIIRNHKTQRMTVAETTAPAAESRKAALYVREAGSAPDVIKTDMRTVCDAERPVKCHVPVTEASIRIRVPAETEIAIDVRVQVNLKAKPAMYAVDPANAKTAVEQFRGNATIVMVPVT